MKKCGAYKDESWYCYVCICVCVVLVFRGMTWCVKDRTSDWAL